MTGRPKPKSINPDTPQTLIKDIQNNMNNITVTCIVLEVNPAVPLKDNHEVRTVKVADNSACINFSVWDEPGAILCPGDIIRVNRAYSIYFRNCLTLYVGKNGDIEKIGEFALPFNESINMSEVNLNAPPPLPAPGANGNTMGNARRTGLGKQNVKPNSFKGNNGKSGPRSQMRPERK